MCLHLWSRKRLRLLPLLVLPLALSACRHPQPVKTPPAPEEPKDFDVAGVQFIVSEGESSQASYNSKGDKIIFVSRKRITHKQDQVYEKDLVTGTERRITFQNGSTYQPRYNPKENSIVYSSSTDELKENPPLLHPVGPPSKLPYPYQEPMEIYVHGLKDFEIDRITLHPGFDGEARFSPDGNTITFTRVNGAKTEIVSYQRKSHAAKVIKDLGDNPTQYTFTPDAKTHAWINWNEDFTADHLMVQKPNGQPKEVAADKSELKTEPAFSPDGKWLLWVQKDSSNPVYDIWITDLDSLCPRQLTTSDEGQRRSPVISPDGRWLTYTLILKGRSRIARQPFTPPTGPCPTTP